MMARSWGGERKKLQNKSAPRPATASRNDGKKTSSKNSNPLEQLFVYHPSKDFREQNRHYYRKKRDFRDPFY